MSRTARLAGVRVGMRRGGVLTLSPNVTLRERDAQREDACLFAAAVALMRFSPQVTLAAEATVLVEVSASLRLFGGVRSLRRQMRDTLTALAMTGRLGIAPTGAGAWLLARHGQERATLSLESLARAVGCVPVALLPEARRAAEWFDGLGCCTLVDVLALPRAGLAKRTSPELLHALDRALGAQAEAYEWLTLPDTFEARQELPDRSERADEIVACAQTLITQLSGWLSARQYRVRRLRLQLPHERGREAIIPTEIEIAFGEPAADADHILRLVRERVERTTLPAAVLAVWMSAVSLASAAPLSDTLFPEPGGTPADHARLLELLIARLGEENVRRPQPLTDHRPEHANRWAPVAQVSKTVATPGHLRRPLWLLETPIALLTRQHRPFYGSPLRITSPAERIEAGWWSGQTTARDYFIAEGRDHCCYWIFRERLGAAEEAEPRWFLHGLFG